MIAKRSAFAAIYICLTSIFTHTGFKNKTEKNNTCNNKVLISQAP